MAGSLAPAEAALLAVNQRFYDSLWSEARLIQPSRFPTWPLVESLAAGAGQRLEVGAGLRPRLPIAGTHFADISLPALRQLREAGGHGSAASLAVLPYPDGAFGLVCAMDILEHVEDDVAALAELARVSRPGGALLLSVPLHPSAWSGFDDLVGHRRRYEPAALATLLAAAGFTIELSAPAGMRPRSSRLASLGLWFLQHQPARAMWWYNTVFMPLGLRAEPRIVLQDGLIQADTLGGLLLFCRRL